jgi:hypothetical protein
MNFITKMIDQVLHLMLNVSLLFFLPTCICIPYLFKDDKNLYFFTLQIDNAETIRTFLSRSVCYLPVYLAENSYNAMHILLMSCIEHLLISLSVQIISTFLNHSRYTMDSPM